MAIIGMSATLYCGTAGTKPTTAMDNVQDVSLSVDINEADITTRAAEGWKTSVSTLKEASLEFTSLYLADDTMFATVRAAALAGTPIALFVECGDGQGLDADWTITNMSIEQPLTEAETVSFTAKPTMDTRAPSWYAGTTTSPN